jgi:hypothetical protein
MGLFGDRVLGIRYLDNYVVGFRRGYGQLLRRLELGMGCWREAGDAARARRRPDSTHCRLLSRATGADVYHGVGVGCGGLGGDEVFQTCRLEGRWVRT